ncbi:MAG: M48 family metalloprotease [Candidatus Omnitrophica bacterium]|nr:M48 family metalloprotease [Candidatus Omnitrophota bacterium]
MLLRKYYLIVVLVFLCGCTSEYNLATGKEERLMYGTDKEINLGNAIALQIEKQVKFVTDLDSNARVHKIFDRLAAVSDRQDIIFTVNIIDDDTVNAFSIPGGYVYIHKGLLDKLKEDDQIAGVLAHEIAHITAKHGLKRMQNSYGALLLQIASFGSGEPELAQGVNAIITSLYFAYSREDEYEADELAVKYTQKAGFDPHKMIDVLEVLKAEDEKAPLRQANYFRTHPYPNERIAVVNKTISGKISFRDYLNLIGSDKQ